MTSFQPVGRQQVFLSLQERIAAGHYPPGSWLPAERALAAEFGMDRSAVRLALTQLEDLGLIVRETGKRPWVRASQTRPHRKGRTGTETPPRQAKIAGGLRTLVAILPQHPVYPASLAIMHGISAVLRSTEAPFRLQVIDTHGGGDQSVLLEKSALESVLHEDIAGVVLWQMGGDETLPPLRDLERRGVPVVFVDRFPEGADCDFVGCDNHAGVEAAVEYLLGLGHRRIAHLTSDELSTAIAERRAAYTETMAAAGIAPHPEWVYTVPQHEISEVGAACDHFFSQPEPPTAVVAMNDALAYRFLAECETRGRRIPDDISVIGFDDIEQHSPRPSLLTTLHQPFDKMGRRAATLLLRRLSGPAPAGSLCAPGARRHILLPAPLIKRATCRPV